MGEAFRAMMFAREVHKAQRRKYTNNPYTDHLAEVAGIVATVDASDTTIAVAWLHDCREDQRITGEQIERRFGMAVAVGVSLLSDFETGNRAERKAAGRVRLASAPAWVQTIKCADLISNTSSIVEHDPKFAVTYLEEKRRLLDVMTLADPRLRAIAYEQARKSSQLTAGANPWYIASMLGHVDVQMVFRIYGKFIAQDFQRPVPKLRVVGD